MRLYCTIFKYLAMKRILLYFFTVATLSVQAQNFIWTSQNSGVEVVLKDVYFTDNQNGWAVGYSGVILNTTNGGQSWTAQQSGVTSNLTAVYFVDANNGYAVGGVSSTGDNARVALKTIDAGATWTAMSVGNPFFGFQDVAFSSPDHGIIVSRDSIYTTSDAGATWVKEEYALSVEGVSLIQAVDSFSDTISLVGGQRNIPGRQSKMGEIFDRRLSNAPNIWGTTTASQIEESDRIFSLEVASATHAFAGGYNGKVYRMITDQINYNGPWKVVLNLKPAANQIMGAISFPTKDFGMVLTDVTIGKTTYSVVYYTYDAGTTWATEPDTITSGIIWSVMAPTPDEVWAVGSRGIIYKGTRSSTAVHQSRPDFDVSIYPNPATDVLNIVMTGKSNESIMYTLTDITGRIIDHGLWSLNPSNSRFEIDVSDAIKGVYFLKLSTEDRQSTFRLIIN